MKRLNEYELNKINGGGSGIVIVVASIAVAIIAGIIDGLTRPLVCR